MFILLNRSFGIGKTTTALRLVREYSNAAISDPEQVGFVLRRMPGWMLGLRQKPRDYQDMLLWRRLIVLQAKWVYRRADVVIVPMAFTNRNYLEAFTKELQKTAPVHKFCLVAPLAVVRSRLAARAMTAGRRGLTDFELIRSEECVAAHSDPFFGIPIDATSEAETIVGEIRRAIQL